MSAQPVSTAGPDVQEDGASMQTVLRSVRRMLSEEGVEPEPGVLTLDRSMLVQTETAPRPEADRRTPSGLMSEHTLEAAERALDELQAEYVRGGDLPRVDDGVRLSRDGAVTLEEMVRAELRLMLRGWLDRKLPALVEDLVREEITRLRRRQGD